MSSVTTLNRRMNMVQQRTARIREQQEDSQVLALITASLSSSLATIGSGSIPAQAENRYTLEQRAALDRFSRRYNAAGAKEDLLRKLESQIQAESEVA